MMAPLFKVVGADNKYKKTIIGLLFLLGFGNSLSLSSQQNPSLTNNNRNNKKVVKVLPPLAQYNRAKPWRYSPPKKSKWDVRHTKSFRFHLSVPPATSATSTPSTNLSSSSQNITQQQYDDDDKNNNNWNVLRLHKKSKESLSHVLGKGILWALFKDRYGVPPQQTMLVETPIPAVEDHYVPDVVAFDSRIDQDETMIIVPAASQQQQRHPQPPTFWGESGRMSAEKAAALASKYPQTHFVHLRWGSRLSMDIFDDIETAVLPTLAHRTAPFEFALLPQEPRWFIDDNDDNGSNTIRIQKENLVWRTARFDIDLDY